MSNPTSQEFQRLVAIMNELREKCPWDQKQTIHTLRHLTIEETYELTDAITSSDWQGIREELGDIMLHIIFYARIAEEQGKFSIKDVITGICEKLIIRHPHIYGDVQVKNAEDVKRNWEQIKLKEGKKSVLGGVPRSLPSMVKAMRLQDKARQVGFEWENREQVWKKIEEESAELHEAVESGEQHEIEAEMGDLFFSLINYSRFLNVDPENALELTNKKFIDRFTQMEKIAQSNGQKLGDMTLQQMDEMWDRIKQKSRD